MSKKLKNKLKLKEMKRKKSLSTIGFLRRVTNENFNKLRSGKLKLKKRLNRNITNFVKCIKTFKSLNKILMLVNRKSNQLIHLSKITIFPTWICQVFQTYNKNLTDN